MTSSDTNQEQEQEQDGLVFRGRKLEADTDIYSFNTWDDVEWTEERQQAVSDAIAAQLAAASTDPSQVDRVMEEAGARWNWFYKHHSRWFFKDRQWLPAEFPELFSASVEAVWEVGCGAGNTLFPLLKHHKNLYPNKRMKIWACDVSEEAVQLVKSFRDFDSAAVEAFVYDANSAQPPPSIPESSLDAITCIFVLSALNPSRLCDVIHMFHKLLKPNGILLIRDYAWGDLAQTRLKPDRVVARDGSVYTRGDGTAVHFFKDGEIALLASGLFTIAQDYTDRRLIVNRKRKLEMFRCWTQVKLIKLE